MLPKIDEGSIIEFRDMTTRKLYDGIVWRVIPESGDNYTLVVRYVDRLRDDYGGLVE